MKVDILDIYDSSAPVQLFMLTANIIFHVLLRYGRKHGILVGERQVRVPFQLINDSFSLTNLFNDLLL